MPSFQPVRRRLRIRAKDYNAQADAVRANQVVGVRGSGIIVSNGKSASTVRKVTMERVVFRISTAAGVYPYGGVEQYDVGTGGAVVWADNPGGITVTTSFDPLYERNGNATLSSSPITYVFAERIKNSLRWVFDRSACMTAGSGSTPTSPTPVPPSEGGEPDVGGGTPPLIPDPSGGVLGVDGPPVDPRSPIGGTGGGVILPKGAHPSPPPPPP